MFFAKRRWALRVIEEMGLSTTSPEGTELADMIIAGAKQHAQMVRTTGVRVTDPELVLMSVAVMSENLTALNRLTQDLGLSQSRASDLLRHAHQAGRRLADQNGYASIVGRLYDR